MPAENYLRGGTISSMMNVQEAISARFFLTSAFLTMTIFMCRSRECVSDFRDGEGSAYRMCSMATSTSQGRTVVFLVTVGLVLFMILFSR